MKAEQKELAARFTTAIKKLASNESALDSFECYLSSCFLQWYKNYADTPQKITDELEIFANMND